MINFDKKGGERLPEFQKYLIDKKLAANIRLPKYLPCSGIHVTTKKKLQSSRNNA